MTCKEFQVRISAQATVEAALVLPIMIVLAFIIYNLMIFGSLCSRFDVVAKNCVIACAASPNNSGDNTAIIQEINQDIRDAMGDGEYQIEVEADLEESHSDNIFELLRKPDTYHVTLIYTPWPSRLQFAGIDGRVPIYLKHEVDVVVDSWKPGVIA